MWRWPLLGILGLAVGDAVWPCYAFLTPSPTRRVINTRIQSSPGEPKDCQVLVSSSDTFAIMPGALSSHGRFYRSTDDKALVGAPLNQEVSVCVVSGSRLDNKECVLGFIRPSDGAAPSKGSTVRVSSGLLVTRSKIPNLNDVDACQLAYYHLCLVPQLVHNGIKELVPEHNMAAAAVVTGAAPQSLYAIQVLRALGYTVIACSRREEAALRSAGASKVLDYSKESFVEAVKGPLAVVVDALGVDADGLSAGLKRVTGAAYVSIMPAAIRRMQMQGLLQGVSLFTSALMGRPENPTTTAYWLPTPAGIDIVKGCFEMAAKGLVSVPPQMSPMAIYQDAITWPRDTESGLRYGFPSVDASSSLDDGALLSRYSEGKAKEAEDTGGELRTAVGLFDDSFNVVGARGAPGDLKEQVMGPVVLFVSSPSCKVCQALKPKVIQLAQEFNTIRFWNLIAGPENYKVAEFLKIPRYPHFIGYWDGNRVFESSSFDAQLIQTIYSMTKRSRGTVK